MLPLFASLGSSPSAEGVLILEEPKLRFILLELPFEAEVGTDGGPAIPEKGDGLSEPPLIFFHEVGDDEGGALDMVQNTLDIPAAQ